MTRKNSSVRSGFEDASVRHSASVIDAAMPTTSYETGLRKLRRMVTADGDLNPSWSVLQEIAKANPGPILDALCEIAGARWEPLPQDPARVLDQVLVVTEGLDEQVRVLRERIEELAKQVPTRTMGEVLPGRGRAA